MSDRQTLVLGGEPRVELLPPEVKLRERHRDTRRLLVLLVILAVVVAGAGITGAYWRSFQAEAALAVAQSRTVELLAEQSRYTDAAALAATVDSVRQARADAASSEVLWQDVTEQIRTHLPEGVELDVAVMLSRLPWAEPLDVTGALREPRVAQASLILVSDTVPDPIDLARALSRIDGYADSSVDMVEWVKDHNHYHTMISLNLNEEALSHRFAEQEGETEATAEPVGGEAEQQTTEAGQ